MIFLEFVMRNPEVYGCYQLHGEPKFRTDLWYSSEWRKVQAGISTLSVYDKSLISF